MAEFAAIRDAVTQFAAGTLPAQGLVANNVASILEVFGDSSSTSDSDMVVPVTQRVLHCELLLQNSEPTPFAVVFKTDGATRVTTTAYSSAAQETLTDVVVFPQSALQADIRAAAKCAATASDNLDLARRTEFADRLRARMAVPVVLSEADPLFVALRDMSAHARSADDVFLCCEIVGADWGQFSAWVRGVHARLEATTPARCAQALFAALWNADSPTRTACMVWQAAGDVLAPLPAVGLRVRTVRRAAVQTSVTMPVPATQVDVERLKQLLHETAGPDTVFAVSTDAVELVSVLPAATCDEPYPLCLASSAEEALVARNTSADVIDAHVREIATGPYAALKLQTLVEWLLPRCAAACDAISGILAQVVQIVAECIASDGRQFYDGTQTAANWLRNAKRARAEKTAAAMTILGTLRAKLCEGFAELAPQMRLLQQCITEFNAGSPPLFPFHWRHETAADCVRIITTTDFTHASFKPALEDLQRLLKCLPSERQLPGLVHFMLYLPHGRLHLSSSLFTLQHGGAVLCIQNKLQMDLKTFVVRSVISGVSVCVKRLVVQTDLKIKEHANIPMVIACSNALGNVPVRVQKTGLKSLESLDFASALTLHADADGRLAVSVATENPTTVQLYTLCEDVHAAVANRVYMPVLRNLATHVQGLWEACTARDEHLGRLFDVVVPLVVPLVQQLLDDRSRVACPVQCKTLHEVVMRHTNKDACPCGMAAQATCLVERLTHGEAAVHAALKALEAVLDPPPVASALRRRISCLGQYFVPIVDEPALPADAQAILQLVATGLFSKAATQLSQSQLGADTAVYAALQVVCKSAQFPTPAQLRHAARGFLAKCLQVESEVAPSTPVGTALVSLLNDTTVDVPWAALTSRQLMKALQDAVLDATNVSCDTRAARATRAGFFAPVPVPDALCDLLYAAHCRNDMAMFLVRRVLQFLKVFGAAGMLRIVSADRSFELTAAKRIGAVEHTIRVPSDDRALMLPDLVRYAEHLLTPAQAAADVVLQRTACKVVRTLQHAAVGALVEPTNTAGPTIMGMFVQAAQYADNADRVMSVQCFLDGTATQLLERAQYLGHVVVYGSVPLGLVPCESPWVARILAALPTAAAAFTGSVSTCAVYAHMCAASRAGVFSPEIAVICALYALITTRFDSTPFALRAVGRQADFMLRSSDMAAAVDVLHMLHSTRGVVQILADLSTCVAKMPELPAHRRAVRCTMLDGVGRMRWRAVPCQGLCSVTPAVLGVWLGQLDAMCIWAGLGKSNDHGCVQVSSAELSSYYSAMGSVKPSAGSFSTVSAFPLTISAAAAAVTTLKRDIITFTTPHAAERYVLYAARTARVKTVPESVLPVLCKAYMNNAVDAELLDALPQALINTGWHQAFPDGDTDAFVQQFLARMFPKDQSLLPVFRARCAAFYQHLQRQVYNPAVDEGRPPCFDKSSSPPHLEEFDEALRSNYVSNAPVALWAFWDWLVASMAAGGLKSPSSSPFWLLPPDDSVIIGRQQPYARAAALLADECVSRVPEVVLGQCALRLRGASSAEDADMLATLAKLREAMYKIRTRPSASRMLQALESNVVSLSLRETFVVQLSEATRTLGVGATKLRALCKDAASEYSPLWFGRMQTLLDDAERGQLLRASSCCPLNDDHAPGWFVRGAGGCLFCTDTACATKQFSSFVRPAFGAECLQYSTTQSSRMSSVRVTGDELQGLLRSLTAPDSRNKSPVDLCALVEDTLPATSPDQLAAALRTAWTELSKIPDRMRQLLEKLTAAERQFSDRTAALARKVAKSPSAALHQVVAFRRSAPAVLNVVRDRAERLMERLRFTDDPLCVLRMDAVRVARLNDDSIAVVSSLLRKLFAMEASDLSAHETVFKARFAVTFGTEHVNVFRPSGDWPSEAQLAELKHQLRSKNPEKAVLHVRLQGVGLNPDEVRQVQLGMLHWLSLPIDARVALTMCGVNTSTIDLATAWPAAAANAAACLARFSMPSFILAAMDVLNGAECAHSCMMELVSLGADAERALTHGITELRAVMDARDDSFRWTCDVVRAVKTLDMTLCGLMFPSHSVLRKAAADARDYALGVGAYLIIGSGTALGTGSGAVLRALKVACSKCASPSWTLPRLFRFAAPALACVHCDALLPSLRKKPSPRIVARCAMCKSVLSASPNCTTCGAAVELDEDEEVVENDKDDDKDDDNDDDNSDNEVMNDDDDDESPPTAFKTADEGVDDMDVHASGWELNDDIRREVSKTQDGALISAATLRREHDLAHAVEGLSTPEAFERTRQTLQDVLDNVLQEDRAVFQPEALRMFHDAVHGITARNRGPSEADMRSAAMASALCAVFRWVALATPRGTRAMERVCSRQVWLFDTSPAPGRARRFSAMPTSVSETLDARRLLADGSREDELATILSTFIAADGSSSADRARFAAVVAQLDAVNVRRVLLRLLFGREVPHDVLVSSELAAFVTQSPLQRQLKSVYKLLQPYALDVDRVSLHAWFASYLKLVAPVAHSQLRYLKADDFANVPPVAAMLRSANVHIPDDAPPEAVRALACVIAAIAEDQPLDGKFTWASDAQHAQLQAEVQRLAVDGLPFLLQGHVLSSTISQLLGGRPIDARVFMEWPREYVAAAFAAVCGEEFLREMLFAIDVPDFRLQRAAERRYHPCGSTFHDREGTNVRTPKDVMAVVREKGAAAFLRLARQQQIRDPYEAPALEALATVLQTLPSIEAVANSALDDARRVLTDFDGHVPTVGAFRDLLARTEAVLQQLVHATGDVQLNVRVSRLLLKAVQMETPQVCAQLLPVLLGVSYLDVMVAASIRAELPRLIAAHRQALYLQALVDALHTAAVKLPAQVAMRTSVHLVASVPRVHSFSDFMALCDRRRNSSGSTLPVVVVKTKETRKRARC